MSDKLYIVAGLALFLIVATFPFWYAFAIADTNSPPDLVLPQAEGITECVMDREDMAANHMKLLLEWRENTVRNADKSTVTVGGKEYPKSLTKGCMSCHTNRKTFCYRCHEYANILQPSLSKEASVERGITCWNCHLAPKED